MKKIIVRTLMGVVVVVVALVAYMGYVFHQAGVVSKGEPIIPGEHDRPALMVIDIQEGITGQLATSFTKSFVEQSEPFIQTVNQVIDKAQQLNMPVIYIRQEYKDKIANFLTGGKMLKAGTPSTEIDARVTIVPGPVLMKLKGDSFSNPKLDAYLQENQINHLYMTGLSATQCVHKTIQAAIHRGYKVTAISDALIADTVEKKEKVLEQYKQEGVIVIKKDELE